MEQRLPANIQELADRLFAIFEADPTDLRLCTKALNDSRRGRHRNGSFEVRISLRYRAIYVVDRGPDGNGDPQYCWYWIGSREDFANFVGCR
jgi:hypothetical protein